MCYRVHGAGFLASNDEHGILLGLFLGVAFLISALGSK